MLTTVLVLLISSPIVFALYHFLVNRLNRRSCKSKAKLNGKTVLVTGATAGIGKETAKDFAKRGARVLLACRDLKKAKTVADSIIEETKNKSVIIYKLDTSSLQSVRNCAKEILKNETRLDILVNNAGMGGSPNKILTKDNLEITMATNYYGHFLFTNLLIDLIKKSSPCRIVNVASQMHRLCFQLDPKNLNFEGVISGSKLAYNQSKLCNVLFTLELSKRLKGTGVTANALHPGIVSSEIFSKVKVPFAKIIAYFIGLIALPLELGAQTSVYVAVSEEVQGLTGKYFDNCALSLPSTIAQNVDLAKRLWEATVKDVGLQPHEIKL